MREGIPKNNNNQLGCYRTKLIPAVTKGVYHSCTKCSSQLYLDIQYLNKQTPGN